MKDQGVFYVYALKDPRVNPAPVSYTHLGLPRMFCKSRLGFKSKVKSQIAEVPVFGDADSSGTRRFYFFNLTFYF